VIRGVVQVKCPACDTEQEVSLIQSINAQDDPAAKQLLLEGQLNMLVCTTCAKRTPVAATLVYTDDDYTVQVTTDTIKAMAAFRGSGVSGRIVKTTNELVEKIKIRDAGLLDWAVELVKLSVDNGPLLFDRLDDELHWIKAGRIVVGLASSRAGYEEAASGEPPTVYVIDRDWALSQLPN
jgi:hypothetical protein